MIQISYMNQAWAISICVLFLLKPLSGFADEGADPFDNTILTFEENIQSTESFESLETLPDQETRIESNTSVALDQPINTRYPITRYSMQGLIKAENKTQMMFVSLEENTKFILSINDCLGLDCAFVTHIDKKGRVTFEDERGIYRFQVGMGSYIVKQKGLIAQDGIISTDAAQQIADGTCAGAGVDNIPEEICQCATFNFWTSLTIEDLNQFNLEMGTAFIKEVYGEEPDEQLEFMGKYAQAVGTDPLPSGAEIPVITEEQAFRGAKGLTMAIINNKNFQEASLYCQEVLDIAENEATDWMLTDEYIKASSYTSFPGLEIGESSDEAMEEIASESGLLLDDTVNLENLLQEIESENLSLKSEIDVLSNSNLELHDTIATQEQTLNQQQENINLLQEELQNSTVKSETTASIDDVDTQNLEDTIASLNSELDNKSKALDDAGNKIAIQEKQIDTLKNDLNTMLSDVNEKLNAKQELINDLESQLLTQSTEISNDISNNNLMVAKADVNIREKPSPDSSIIGVLLKDSTINVEDTVQGWYKINIKGGKEGYIYSPMLKENN